MTAPRFKNYREGNGNPDPPGCTKIGIIGVGGGATKLRMEGGGGRKQIIATLTKFSACQL